MSRAADYERRLIDENQMNNAMRVFTSAAQQAQAERGSSKAYERRIAEGFPDRVTAELAKFIAEQDTAFIATATADGSPYIQHRGVQRVSSRSSTTKRSALPITAATGSTSRSPISPRTTGPSCSCSTPRDVSASRSGAARASSKTTLS